MQALTDCPLTLHQAFAPKDWLGQVHGKCKVSFRAHAHHYVFIHSRGTWQKPFEERGSEGVVYRYPGIG